MPDDERGEQAFLNRALGALDNAGREHAALLDAVEQGKMTKDLAILVGPDQPWMTTEQFFEAIRANLEKAMSVAA